MPRRQRPNTIVRTITGETTRSVKLLEFLLRGLYSFAFETNRASDSVMAATGEEEMATLFVPLAPNPVVGGFLINASRDRKLGVDTTLEGAASALVTSGIAAGDADDRRNSVDPLERVRGIGTVDEVVDGLRPTDPDPDPGEGDGEVDRRDRS